MKYGTLFLLVIVMLCYFETMLASNKNKYVGLILPILTFTGLFIWSIFLVNEFNILKFIGTLIFINIPTYLQLLFYRAGRKQYKTKRPTKKPIE